MKFGAFIITFNRPLILKKTLQCVMGQTLPPDTVLIVDNGDSKETKKVLQSLSYENVSYHSMGENLGPSGATAYALQWMVQQEYDWIYWVDDDDPPSSSDILENLFHLIRQVDQPNLGGVGVVGSPFDWRKGEMKRLPDQALKGILSVDVIAGNQQLILKRQMIDKVGVTDKRLFFGLYEPEYCLRIRQAGYRLYVDGGMMLEERRKAGRLNINPKRSIISPYPTHQIWQRYYRTRNYIFMMRNTFRRPDLARRETLKALGRSLTCWFRSQEYGIKFSRLQLQGVRDGYGGRMGRTVEPEPKYIS